MKQFLVSFLVIALMSAGLVMAAKSVCVAPQDGALNGNPFSIGCDASQPQKDKIEFIHYKDGTVKGTGNSQARVTQCYAYLSKGMPKWRTLAVSYIINPTGSNLDQDFVKGALAASSEEWDRNTNSELFNLPSINSGVGYGDDDINSVTWGNYPASGVIAVTGIWGYFRGPSSMQRITEFDVMFDTDFTWGDAESNPRLMDLQNIATHELGHGVGLGDLYTSACYYETMYGRSYEGDLVKRTLNGGDITGIRSLYG